MKSNSVIDLIYTFRYLEMIEKNGRIRGKTLKYKVFEIRKKNEIIFFNLRKMIDESGISLDGMANILKLYIVFLFLLFWYFSGLKYKFNLL